jgi:hypothetical protein
VLVTDQHPPALPFFHHHLPILFRRTWKFPFCSPWRRHISDSSFWRSQLRSSLSTSTSSTYLLYSDKRTLVALVTGFCGCPLSEISQKPQLSCIMVLHTILDQCALDDNNLHGFAANSHANFNLHRTTAYELGFQCQLPLNQRTLSAHLTFTSNKKVT